MKTNLLKEIQNDRAQKRIKQPFIRSIFDRISFMVKEYGLKENFLEKIDRFSEHVLREKLLFPRLRVKRKFESPLFSMASPDDYRLTLAILKRINNPYLDHVHSPEEIVLSRTLYTRNSSISTEVLSRCHFETLLLFELARDEAQQLKQQIKSIERKRREVSRDRETFLRNIACSVGFVVCTDDWSSELIYDKPPRLDVLQDRLVRLQKFINTVEEYTAAESGIRKVMNE